LTRDSADGVRVWEVATGTERLRVGDWAAFQSAGWDERGERILTVGYPRVEAWDAQSGVLVTERTRPDDFEFALWNSTGTRFAAFGPLGEPMIWDAAARQPPFRLAGARELQSLGWNPQGTRLYTIDGASVLKIWDAQTGVEAFKLDPDKHMVYAAVWDPGGTRLLFLGDGVESVVWDSETEKGVPLIGSAEEFLEYGAWNSRGTQVLTSGFWDLSAVWDARTGEQVYSIDQFVVYAAWNAQDTHLLTVSADARATVRDAGTGEPLFVLSDRARHAAWDASGKRVAIQDAENRVRIYTIEPGALIQLACSRVGRNLSEEEIALYVDSDLAYRDEGAVYAPPLESSYPICPGLLGSSPTSSASGQGLAPQWDDLYTWVW
jgi:WD40 repeat protein